MSKIKIPDFSFSLYFYPTQTKTVNIINKLVNYIVHVKGISAMVKTKKKKQNRENQEFIEVVCRKLQFYKEHNRVEKTTYEQ